MRLVRRAGFTLVEMLTVVAILSVLAAISIGAYRKYSDAGRTAEAMAMIGEIRTKENAYYAENNAYLTTNTTSADSAATDLWPNVPSSSCVEPCAKDIVTNKPAPWSTLGIATQRNQLYCGYLALAPGAHSWGGATTDAKNAVGGSAAPAVAWFYIHAVCDNNAAKSANTEYIATSENTSVVTLNEHN